jgi:hypothetical protein
MYELHIRHTLTTYNYLQMGLERDGSFLGLSPFESELRRRIWWQLKMHDTRTAELCGLAKFRDFDMGAESTKWPTNINDDQLQPGMTSLTAVENKITDVVFIAFRCEMMGFAVSQIAKFRKLGLNMTQWNLDETRDGHSKGEMSHAVHELQDKLETKYLRYLDPSQPLHLLTMLVGRYGMNVVTFLTHHPRSWSSMGRQVSDAERQLVWDVSVKLLEQHNMVQSNEMLRQFSWHTPYFRQWHAFILVLDTLRADPLKADANKAWALITGSYEHTRAMVTDMQKPIHVAVGNLCLKAFAARETALRNENTYSPPPPAFILQLRRWRELAKVKQQMRAARRDRQEGGSVAINACYPPEATTTTNDTLSQPPNTLESDTSSNQFNFFDGFDYDQIEDSAMNFDFMLPEDNNMEDNILDPINWEQWDSWLAESNVMRS